MKTNRYSDIDMNFSFNPNTGDLIKKVNDSAIKQHINLLFIDKGLPFRPEMDSGIGGLLFENFTDSMKFNLKNRIKEHLRTYEPRIEVLEVSVEEGLQRKLIDIKIRYKISHEEREVNFDFVVGGIR